MYPIHINLSGKPVVVAGGGSVAYRKIKDLLEQDAHITVVSPEAVEDIQKWHSQKKLEWAERKVRVEDLQDAFLIIAATNSSEVNSWIAAQAKTQQLVNVADQPHLGNFIIPSVVKRGKLVLSVSTSGASPSLSASIKKELQQRYSEDYESYLDFLFECRSIIKKEFPEESRKALLTKLTDSSYIHEADKRNVYKQALFSEIQRKHVSKPITE